MSDHRAVIHDRPFVPGLIDWARVPRSPTPEMVEAMRLCTIRNSRAADPARPFESPFTSAVDAAPTAPTSDIEDALLSSLCAMVTRYVELANSGDAGNWDPEIIPDVINARAAIMLALTDGRPNGRSTPDASPAHENPSNVEKQA